MLAAGEAALQQEVEKHYAAHNQNNALDSRAMQEEYARLKVRPLLSALAYITAIYSGAVSHAVGYSRAPSRSANPHSA